MDSISDYLDRIVAFFPNFGLVFVITVITMVQVLIYLVIEKKLDDTICINKEDVAKKFLLSS